MKRKLLILLLAMLVLSMSLTSCGGNKEIISLKIVEGLSYEVTVGATPDYSKVKATVEYNDKTTKDLTGADLTFSTIDTSKAGTQKLTITYSDFSITVDITVKAAAQQPGDDEPYSVEGATLPAALTKFLSKSFSDNFQDREAIYKVGDDNPFRFTLTLSTWDNVNNEPGDDITSYVSLSKVYLVTGTTEQLLTGTDLATYVTVDENNNTFDFTDAAVGKTFRIETRPADGVDETDADTVAAVTKSLTVEVVDAYNVYSAKELNLITNASHANIPDYGQTTKTQLEMVEEFLQNNNITRPANMAGVVLHCDLTVTADDIPAGYLYSYTNKAGEPAKGLYDHFSIFYHVYNSASPSFGMYGNYFTVNTAMLPCVCEPPYAGNSVDDDSSSSEVFAFDVTDEEIWAKGLSYDHNDYRTRVENIFISSEDPNSNTEQEAAKSKLGLIGFKMYLHTSDFYNVIIEKHTLSICADSDNNTINIDKCYFFNSWNMHIYAWSNNYIMDELDLDNSDPSVYANYQPIVINIKNSTIAKCGGPAIIADPANTTDLRNKNSGAIITAENSTIYSYVQGSEAWFNTYGVAQMATKLISMNQPFSSSASACGATANFAKEFQGYVGVRANLIYVNRGKNGSFTVKDTITIDQNDATAAAYVQATGGQAPVFQSSTGGTAFYNDITFLSFTGDPGNPIGNPDPSLFTGNYLNIYFGGMSIMVEMFH